MQHVFPAWRQIARRLRTARHIFFLSDYDGTLTPIVERPELARLPPQTKELLQTLTRQRRHYTVAIISGRALRDLAQRVGIKGIIYAGNHGLEIEGPGMSFVNPIAEEMKPVFRLLHGVLHKALQSVRGVLIEDKGLTLSVHYRLVAKDKEAEVKNIFESIISTALAIGKLRVTTGKKVYEVRPAVAWDKGKAVELLLERYGKPKGEVLPLFLGDDLTDEDAFKVVNSLDGVSIFVGEDTSHSVAHYSLRSPAEVDEFLTMLLQSSEKSRKEPHHKLVKL